MPPGPSHQQFPRGSRWKAFPAERRELSFFCKTRKRLPSLRVPGLRGGGIAVISFTPELWLKQETSCRATGI